MHKWEVKFKNLLKKKYSRTKFPFQETMNDNNWIEINREGC